jgi:hypothetical protein
MLKKVSETFELSGLLKSPRPQVLHARQGLRAFGKSLRMSVKDYKELATVETNGATSLQDLLRNVEFGRET